MALTDETQEVPSRCDESTEADCLTTLHSPLVGVFSVSISE